MIERIDFILNCDFLTRRAAHNPKPHLQPEDIVQPLVVMAFNRAQSLVAVIWWAIMDAT